MKELVPISFRTELGIISKYKYEMFIDTFNTFDIPFYKKILIYYKNVKHSVEMISHVHPNIMLKSLWLGRKKSFQT